MHGPGDQGEVIAADLAPLDVEHGALAVADLRGGELVRLEDRHHPVDAGLSLQAEAFDVDVLLDVADRPDHGQARALDRVGERPGSLDLLDDRLDLLGGRGLLHHDHHRFILSCYAWSFTYRPCERGVVHARVRRSVRTSDPVRPPAPALTRAGRGTAEAPR